MDADLLARAYDREADRYDERFGEQQRPKFEAVAALVPPPRARERVLDLGGGTGLLRGALSGIDPRWNEARFLVVDLSRRMLEKARARGQLCVLADARRLPFRRASFARVLCVTGVVDESHLARALQSASRVLAPDGVFALGLRARMVDDGFAALVAHAGLAVVRELEVAGDRLFVLEHRG